MKVLTITAEEECWDGFVDSHQQGIFYHRFAWGSLINRTFGHRCHYLAAVDKWGRWQGILPLVHMRSRLFGSFLVSVPFVNYGGLLYNNVAAAAALLKQAELVRRSVDAAYVEFRHVGKSMEELPSREHKVTMILELAVDEESQWKNFNAKLRNQIRKAEKSELRWTQGRLELLDDFYTVFSRNMRDLGTPVYPKSFFRNVLETFPETTRVFAVYLRNSVIAAGVGSWFKDTLEIPWASSISEYKALCPNNMLYWEAIRFAIGRGFKKFDFGRSTPGEGTYNFKKQWGAIPVQLYWQYITGQNGALPNLSPSNPKYQSAIRVWQRLPLPITKWLGPMIVRNIP